jgi:hypothetical protein
MAKFVQWFRSCARANRAHAEKPRRRERLRPTLESLEDRLVLNVTFNPVLGAESYSDNGGLKLNDVPTYLIFWGKYWQSNQGLANSIRDAAQSILSGPYVQNLTQYGVTGKAYLAGTYYDASDPNPGSFDMSDVADVVDGLQDGGSGLPEYDDLSRIPIYCVVTAPGIMSSNSVDASINSLQYDDDFPWTDTDKIPVVWLGGNQAFGLPASASLLDEYTSNFSHEVGEAITSIGGDGIVVTQGSKWSGPTDHQIADAEAMFYRYRLNGYLVQSFWSGQDGAYLVPDGNSQTLKVNGLIDGTLTINGDQLGNPNDSITIDVVSSGPSAGGLQVTLNNETFQFDKSTISSVIINPGSGTNTVNVNGLPAGVNVTVNDASGSNDTITVNAGQVNFDPSHYVTINNDGGTDTVNVEALAARNAVTVNNTGSGQAAVNVSPGAGNWGNVQGLVTVNGNSASTALTINDRNDQRGEAYSLDAATMLSRVNAGPINISGLSSLTLLASAGQNVVNVSPATHNLYWVTTLTVDGGGGAALTLDDGANAAATAYTITANSLTRSPVGRPAATINYAHLTGLKLLTGSAADVVNVEGIPAPTTVIGGGGAETFNVAPASLNLGGINGTLTFDGGTGGATLTVNDQANPTSSGLLFKPTTQYTVTGGSLTRTVFYPFPLRGGGSSTASTINYKNVTTLTLNAGNKGANTIDVESTAIPTYVHGGTATSSISVAYNLKTLDNIGAYLSISGASSDLAVYDQADTDANAGKPIAYVVSDLGITRDALYNKSDVLTRIDTVPVKSVTFYTSQTKGSLPNTVSAGSSSAPVTVLSGAADAVTVTALGGPLAVDAHGGTVTFDDRGVQNSISYHTTNPQHTQGYIVTDYNLGYTITDHTVVRSEHVHWFEVIEPGPGNSKGGQVAQDYYFNGTFSYQNATSLTIAGSPVDSTFAVQSTPTGMPVAITGSTGSRVSVPGIPWGPTVNQFIVGLNGSVKNIRSQLTLNGSGPGDTLLVDDSQATLQDKVTVTPTQVGAGAADQFFAPGGSLTYGGLSALTLNLSHAADDVVQLTPTAATAITINGDPTEFLAGHGVALNVDLTGIADALLTPSGPGAGTWTFTKGSHQPVTFKNVGAVHSH